MVATYACILTLLLGIAIITSEGNPVQRKENRFRGGGREKAVLNAVEMMKQAEKLAIKRTPAPVSGEQIRKSRRNAANFPQHHESESRLQGRRFSRQSERDAQEVNRTTDQESREFKGIVAPKTDDSSDSSTKMAAVWSVVGAGVVVAVVVGVVIGSLVYTKRKKSATKADDSQKPMGDETTNQEPESGAEWSTRITAQESQDARFIIPDQSSAQHAPLPSADTEDKNWEPDPTQVDWTQSETKIDKDSSEQPPQLEEIESVASLSLTSFCCATEGNGKARVHHGVCVPPHYQSAVFRSSEDETETKKTSKAASLTLKAS